MFCKKCGGKLESYASNCAFCGTPVEKYNEKMNYVKEEKKVAKLATKPMGAWRWIGFYLLPCIPFVGFIIQIVLIFKWAFGKHGDDTLRGYARSQLIIALFALILVVVAIVFVALNPKMLDELKNELQEEIR